MYFILTYSNNGLSTHCGPYMCTSTQIYKQSVTVNSIATIGIKALYEEFNVFGVEVKSDSETLVKSCMTELE